MVTTQQSIPIVVKCTNMSDGEDIKVTNLTEGGTIRGQVKSAECILNPQNSNLSWNNGAVISIESNGRILQSKSVTITKGGARTTLDSSSADDSPAVSL